MLTKRHKVLGCLNKALSISAKNVFNFFFGNFMLCVMCYVSLEFPALKVRQVTELENVMPEPLWLKLKTDQSLHSTTFVTQTKYP